MMASSGANTRGAEVSAPGPSTSPEQVEAHRDDCQRNDRLARLQREERGIIDHDVDIGRDTEAMERVTSVVFTRYLNHDRLGAVRSGTANADGPTDSVLQRA